MTCWYAESLFGDVGQVEVVIVVAEAFEPFPGVVG